MARYNRDGTLYIKNVTGVTVPADGTIKGVFAKAIPPYAVVNRYWVHCWMTGDTAVPMHAKQHVVLSGRMANMPNDIQDIAAGSTMDELNEVIGAFMPRSAVESFDGDEADVADTDLVGQGIDMSQIAKRREWLHYETMLGGGKNSYITKADAIRFNAEYQKTGTVSGYGCNVDQWRIIGIDVNTNGLASDINQSVEKHIWGDTTANPEVLARGLYQFYGHQGVSMFDTNNYAQSNEDGLAAAMLLPELERSGLQEDTTFNTITNWARTGFGTSGDWSAGQSDDTAAGSGFDNESGLIVQTRVTLEIKTLKPRTANVWTPN